VVWCSLVLPICNLPAVMDYLPHNKPLNLLMFCIELAAVPLPQGHRGTGACLGGAATGFG